MQLKRRIAARVVKRLHGRFNGNFRSTQGTVRVILFVACHAVTRENKCVKAFSLPHIDEAQQIASLSEGFRVGVVLAQVESQLEQAPDFIQVQFNGLLGLLAIRAGGLFQVLLQSFELAPPYRGRARTRCRNL